MEQALTLASVCAPSTAVVARAIENEIVIVPLLAGVGDAEDELYTLNRTGQAIWQQLDGRRTLGEVAETLAAEYDESPEVIQAAVLAFTTELARRGILTVAG